MPNRRTLILSPFFLLISACNMPQPIAIPNPLFTDTPAFNITPQAPSPTDIQFTATFALPTGRPTSTPAYATIDEFFDRCPTAKEVAALEADIPVTIDSDPTAGTLACKESEGSLDLTPLQKRAYQSILIMKVIRFDAPLPWTDKSLYPWFVDTVDGIRFRTGLANSFCCEPANVINIQVADNSFIFLTDRWIDPAMGGGLMDTMVLYVHEARHNEGYVHTCNCDDNTIAEMGSWGVQYYLFQWLAQHIDPAFFWAPGGDADYYRRIALGNMVSTRKLRFCKEPTVTPGAEPTLAK
ncbi:MAG: hypothetical protein WBM17_04030 [Anaerolineales bacterium]